MKPQTAKKHIKNICIDVDGVLVDTRRELAQYCKDELGAEVNAKCLERFKLHEILGIPKSKSIDIVSRFYRERQEQFGAFQGAREALLNLSNLYEIYAVTGRPEYGEYPTRRCIERLYPHLIKDVLFAQAHDIKTPRGRPTKGEICEHLDSAFMVDDDSVYSEECVNKGITVLYLNGDKPLASPKAIEVASWQDILRYGTRRFELN